MTVSQDCTYSKVNHFRGFSFRLWQVVLYLTLFWLGSTLQDFCAALSPPCKQMGKQRLLQHILSLWKANCRHLKWARRIFKSLFNWRSTPVQLNSSQLCFSGSPSSDSIELLWVFLRIGLFGFFAVFFPSFQRQHHFLTNVLAILDFIAGISFLFYRQADQPSHFDSSQALELQQRELILLMSHNSSFCCFVDCVATDLLLLFTSNALSH